MIIETLSTFPHMYDSVMGESMMKRAQEKGLLEFRAHDLRDWTHDRHRTTDDDPYGGGAGLVMKCEPIFEAVEDILGDSLAVEVEPGGDTGCSDRASLPKGTTRFARSPHATETVQWTVSPSEDCLSESGYPVAPLPDISQQHKPKIVFLAPQGRTFDDAYATELAEEKHLLFICGHYEGIDERVYALADHIISLGDYVLTSGELASMVVIDAVVRKIPGVLGAAEGPIDESFTSGLLEYPQYTRPATFRGMEVPPVLLSGNHAAVAQWRRQQSLLRTAQQRPDLLRTFEEEGLLTADDQKYLLSCGVTLPPGPEGVS